MKSSSFRFFTACNDWHLNLGYHLLLEKPMAVTEEDCEEIAKACTDAQVIVAVCHVLRQGFEHCNPE